MQNPDISSQNQPQYDPEHEEKKKKQSKIMKEIQRLLSDDNLKRDKNLLNLLQKNQTVLYIFSTSLKYLAFSLN